MIPIAMAAAMLIASPAIRRGCRRPRLGSAAGRRPWCRRPDPRRPAAPRRRGPAPAAHVLAALSAAAPPPSQEILRLLRGRSQPAGADWRADGQAAVPPPALADLAVGRRARRRGAGPRHRQPAQRPAALGGAGGAVRGRGGAGGGGGDPARAPAPTGGGYPHRLARAPRAAERRSPPPRAPRRRFDLPLHPPP